MDLALPERTVIPSLDAAVLVTLSALSTPVTGRELARSISDASLAGVQRVLSRLSSTGLVTLDRRSGANFYSMNREHLAWPAVEVLANLRRELLARLRTTVTAWPVGVLTAAVFGSLARGEGGLESDIDLLLVRDGELLGTRAEAWEQQVDDLVSAVERWTGNRLSPYDITEAELRAHVENQEPLVASWNRDAITVAGREFRSVLRGVSR
jgi:predicted nucleotidyltransferase